MKRIVVLATFFLVSTASSISQNCWNTTTGFPPISDLGTGSWRGLQGGLYPGGMNTRPSEHNAEGMNLASHVRPLSLSGLPDSTAGKIVLMSIGMSNAQQEFGKVELFYDTLQNKSPYVQVVNGAQGGWHIAKILNPDTAYWSNIDSILQLRGLNSLQVQVVWFKEADLHPEGTAGDTSFPGYVTYLKEMFKEAMHIMKEKFPNLKLCYVSSRIYGGYETTSGHPEPFAYYQGWAVKQLIEDQINGDTSLVFSGPNARSPWLSWGPYLWADGLTPRGDGLTWICPDDFMPDGRHPSNPIGREKVGHLVMDFFTTDETTLPWFLTIEVPPAAPSNLAATANGTDRIALVWTDNSVNETGFRIERKSQVSSFQEIALVAPEIESYLDTGLLPGQKYIYRVRTFNSGGTSLYSNKAGATTVAGEQAGHPTELNNYPNPFNPTTRIFFKIPADMNVTLALYDVLGREVAVLLDGFVRSGYHHVTLDGSSLASGTYLYTLKTGSFTESKRLLLLK